VIGQRNNSIKQHPLGFKVVYLSPFPQTLEDGSNYTASGQKSIVRCNIYDNGGTNDPHTHEFRSIGGPVVGDVSYVFYDVRLCQPGDVEEDLYHGYRTTVSPDGTNEIELVFRRGLHAEVSRTLVLNPGASYSIRPAEQVSHGERGGEFHGVAVEAGRVCMTLFTKEPARHMGRSLFLSQNPDRVGSY
jgi:hypothetical protein